MTQRRNNPDSISNYFDRITSGIGHRGSSFTDIDNTQLYLTHDARTERGLLQEFKKEGEGLSWGQEVGLRWLARFRQFTVWVVVKQDDGKLRFWHVLPAGRRDKNEQLISEDEYVERFRQWWNPAQ